MNLTFKKPLTPNFVSTEQGIFDIKDLDDQELIKFMEFWKQTLLENRKIRKRRLG